MAGGYKYFEAVEKHAGLLGIMIAIMVSIGGLAEITPLFVEANRLHPADGLKPYAPLRLVGKDIYVREGCHVCHTQMIRTLSFETQRYGHYSTASESVYDRPFQWGSKRTGPDLARIGVKYSDDWQRLHLADPRKVVPQSNMPSYPWLLTNTIDGADVQARMRALKFLGDGYTDADIDAAPKDVAGKTEMDALVAYLQGLGVDNVATAQATSPAGEGGSP